jgi:hypothetical protein
MNYQRQHEFIDLAPNCPATAGSCDLTVVGAQQKRLAQRRKLPGSDSIRGTVRMNKARQVQDENNKVQGVCVLGVNLEQSRLFVSVSPEKSISLPARCD